MKKWIWVLLVLGLLSIPWSGQAQTWQQSFKQQVQDWSKELSKKDQRFTPFTNGIFHYQPLGPHSKQWLVTFYSDHEEAGYMVVEEGQKQFFLLEYGLGEYTLFDEEPVVSLQLDRSSRIPLYAGLQSVWVSEDGLFDAKSGEKYPIDTQIPTYSLSSSVHQNDLLTLVKESQTSDYTEPWIKPKGSIKTENNFVDSLDERVRISFIGHLFEGQVLAPFTVLGFHKWEGTLFVEMEDDGSRFIPFQHALDLGAFYK